MELTLGEMDLGPHSWRGVCTLDFNLGEVDHGTHSWRDGPWTTL